MTSKSKPTLHSGRRVKQHPIVTSGTNTAVPNTMKTHWALKLANEAERAGKKSEAKKWRDIYLTLKGVR